MRAELERARGWFDRLSLKKRRRVELIERVVDGEVLRTPR